MLGLQAGRRHFDTLTAEPPSASTWWPSPRPVPPDEDDPPTDEPEKEGPPLREDDSAFIRACGDLERFFGENPKELFYERQLCVRFEKLYFHWITARALKRLAELHVLTTDLEVIPDLRDEDGVALTLRFYRAAGHRYWRRQRGEIADLVRRMGQLGHAIGDYGELLCDGGLGPAGFVRRAKHTREWNDVKWTNTEHNLDRIYVSDGIAYGCEIKNTLKYFPVPERLTKQAMCERLGIRPLFVVRWLPKSHIYEVYKAGGFAILFEHQLYPVGQEALAAEVRDRLGLPVKCAKEFPEDAVIRLVKLHVSRRREGPSDA